MQKRKRYSRRDWNEWLASAEQYRAQFGDLCVPRSYITPDGYRLGRWIERQRAAYNGVLPGSLNPHRIRALERLGMIWKLEDRNEWESWLESARQYRDSFGSLLVPKEYECEGRRLGNWICEQRKKYADGLLTDDQIRSLDKLGMCWSVCARRDWMDWFADAQRYFDEHGDLLVPTAYITGTGYRLGNWIFSQREKYHGKNSRAALSREQIRLLEGIGMEWDLSEFRRRRWNTIYEWVRGYRVENGKLPVWPRSLTTEDGWNVPSWIEWQRRRAAAGKCSAEEADLLREIGILTAEEDKLPAVAGSGK